MRRTSLIASAVAASLAATAVVAANIEAKGQVGTRTLNLTLKNFKYVQVKNPQLNKHQRLP